MSDYARSVDGSAGRPSTLIEPTSPAKTALQQLRMFQCRDTFNRILRMAQRPPAKKTEAGLINSAEMMFRQLSIWAQSHQTTVSRIPLHLLDFRWFDPDIRHNRKGLLELEEKSMNIDNLVKMIGNWLCGRVPTIQTFEHHYFSSNIVDVDGKSILRVAHGLQNGEVEHPITQVGSKTQWLGRYPWRVHIGKRDEDICCHEGRTSAHPTAVDMWLYLDNLPEQLHYPIPWQDENRARDLEHYTFDGSKGWKHVSHWKDTNEACAWEAFIKVDHCEFTDAVLADPRAYFPRFLNCHAIFIDQRTGERGYKHVVISKPGGIHGNDLLGMKTQDCTPALHFRTSRMIAALRPKVPLEGTLLEN